MFAHPIRADVPMAQFIGFIAGTMLRMQSALAGRLYDRFTSRQSLGGRLHMSHFDLRSVRLVK